MTAKEIEQVIQELGRRIDEIAQECGVACGPNTGWAHLTLKILADGLQSEETDQ